MLPVLRNGSMIDRVFGDFNRLWEDDLYSSRDSFGTFLRTIQESVQKVEDTTSWTYKLSIPQNVDVESIRAEVEDGYLTVTIPKPQSQARQIPITKPIEGEASEVTEEGQ